MVRSTLDLFSILWLTSLEKCWPWNSVSLQLSFLINFYLHLISTDALVGEVTLQKPYANQNCDENSSLLHDVIVTSLADHDTELSEHKNFVEKSDLLLKYVSFICCSDRVNFTNVFFFLVHLWVNCKWNSNSTSLKDNLFMLIWKMLFLTLT